MNDINQVTLSGVIKYAPQLASTTSGKQTTTTALEVSREVTYGQYAGQTFTQLMPLRFYGAIADAVARMGVGWRVVVQGSLDREPTSKTDSNGKKLYRTVLKGESVLVLAAEQPQIAVNAQNTGAGGVSNTQPPQPPPPAPQMATAPVFAPQSPYLPGGVPDEDVPDCPF